MRTTKFLILLVLTGLNFACTRSTSIKPADSQVIGRWNLVKLTYGFSQISKTPAEAGYSEVVTFNADGTYQRLVDGQDGKKEEKGRFYTGANLTKTADRQAIFYPDDTTTQPYSFRDDHLFLYQRGEQGATIYDGSTYEYQQQ